MQLKNMVVPRIINMASESKDEIKIQALICLNKLLKMLDKNIISD